MRFVIRWSRNRRAWQLLTGTGELNTNRGYFSKWKWPLKLIARVIAAHHVRSEANALRKDEEFTI